MCTNVSLSFSSIRRRAPVCVQTPGYFHAPGTDQVTPAASETSDHRQEQSKHKDSRHLGLSIHQRPDN